MSIFDDEKNSMFSDYSAPRAASGSGGMIWIVAGVLVGAIIASAGMILTLRGSDQAPTAAGAAPQQTEPEPPTSETPEPPVEVSLPTSAPDTKWDLFWQFPVPASTVHGPTGVEGGIARGFPQSPEGALFAGARYIHTIPAAMNWPAVLLDNVVAGPSRDALSENIKSAIAERWARLCEGDQATNASARECKNGGTWAPNDISADDVCIATGFRFANYTPEQAAIELDCRSNNGKAQRLSLTLIWENDIWKLVPTEDGKLFPEPGSPENTDGVIAWEPDRKQLAKDLTQKEAQKKN